MILGIDFDGTVVQHKYPDVGREAPNAFYWLRRFAAKGARLVLFTMRDGRELADAAAFCRANGVEFWGLNENPEQKAWTQSPKVYAHRYIDNAAVGCPLRRHPAGGEVVDWDAVGPVVEALLDEEAARKAARPATNEGA